MSSKLNPKTSKKDRPRSSDRLKNKKRDGTPEKSITPQEITDDNRPPSMNVIWNEEIEKLQIKPEEIEKIHEPKPPVERKKTPIGHSISVRKVRPVSEEEKHVPLNVTVAKPAPEDAPLKPINYTGYGGPRYNEQGDVLSHSLLGKFEDFHNEAVKRGDFINVETPRVDYDQSDKPTVKYEKKKRPPSSQSRKTANENNALINWQLKMLERKKQQGYISKLLQKSPGDLVMNQSDYYRKVQERREVIDKTIPAVDYGKGYRHGSEFWNQQKLMGDEIRGIHMSLNDTEKGNYPPLQRIGLSEVARQERDHQLQSRWNWTENYRTEAHYPWHKTSYLSTRLKQLQPLINELDPHQPEFDGLEVIGNKRIEDKQTSIETDTELTQAYDETSDQQIDDPLSDHPDVHPAPIFGPSLQFAGQPARWTGDSHSFRQQVGIEARVTFEAYTNDRITSYLEIVNDGTTSIYYDWKKVTNNNKFDLVKSNVQRFYFNNSNGVILPGETMKFPFVFKSPNAGVFSEQWLFETRPVVCGGADLIVTLRGVALQEDIYKKQRETLEEELKEKQAKQVVGQLLYELIDGIKTPDRSRSPIDAYITTEEIFIRLNHGMCYKHEYVEELKRIWHQLLEVEEQEHEEWDLCIDTLKQRILELSEENELKEAMLTQVNQAAQKMSFMSNDPVIEDKEQIVHNQLAEAIDNICGYSIYLRKAVGLPERYFNDSDRDAKEPEVVVVIETKKKPQRKPGAKATPELEAPSSDTRKSRASDKVRSDSKQDKKLPTIKDQKSPKGGKETPKGLDAKGKITPALVKKPPSRIGTVSPIDEKTLSQPNSPTPEPSADTLLNRKYKEKLHAMTYFILGEMVSKIEDIFKGTHPVPVLKLT